jgi:Gas vesicle synthesis protein GvpL/GvpF
MNAVYVFALSGRAVAPFTVEGRHIEFVDVRGIFAAIERSVERPNMSEAALRTQHNIVMTLSDRIDDLLPARFGAWVELRELEDLVARRDAAIREALALVRGRVQMTIRFPQLPDAGDMPLAAVSSGTAYLEQKRQASRRLPSIATGLADAVRHLVIAERVAPPTERTGAAVYHLIERAGITEYLAATATRPPNATVTGPWPAFAFVPDLWP